MLLTLQMHEAPMADKHKTNWKPIQFFAPEELRDWFSSYARERGRTASSELLHLLKRLREKAETREVKENESQK